MGEPLCSKQGTGAEVYGLSKGRVRERRSNRQLVNSQAEPSKARGWCPAANLGVPIIRLRR